MTAPIPRPGTDRDAQAGTGRAAHPGMPGWLKVTGIVVGVLVLLTLIVMLTGLGGDHGPGRHMGSSGQPSLTASDAAPGAGRA
ncbi:hypothetical protein ACFV2X_25375 [Streptomyces sp. NPDC059679]|uniref:hypothetical protein n=1 Tax=Streptomyces sp. NPDC059679 TaxID=3346903 RepID=UPI0036A2263D